MLNVYKGFRATYAPLQTTSISAFNLDAQMSSNCFEKKKRFYTMVNMPAAGIKFEIS